MKSVGSEVRTGLLLVIAIAANCWCANAGKAVQGKSNKAAGPVRFAVISDPHLFNARLGTTGGAFEAYLNQDPKLLAQSEAILDSALSAILQEQVQFLIISGDLTKDGELVDHVLMAQHLAKLRQRGIQVFVVPGNHDINNPDAVTYAGDSTRPVPNTSPETFVALYQRFGYGQAIARDPASLSYVAEPVPGVRLLAIDSCKYRENLQLGTPVTSGEISNETMSWILPQIEDARTAGKQVIAFMHHGVNQHFLPEPILFPEFLVDDWPVVSGQLAGAGLRVVFTGHYHSQDAAYPLDAVGRLQQTLCDIETSALVVSPCAFRIVTIDEGMLDVRSERVTAIEADTGGLPLQEFAAGFLRQRLPLRVIPQLEAMFGLSEQEAASVAPLVVDAIIANYAGDEAASPRLQAYIAGLMASGEPFHTLGRLLAGFWTDIPPRDNNLVVPFTF
jgi:hypothetical protein